MIQPIVEGFGEVEATPVLLRRLLSEAGVYEFGIGTPIRRKRSELVRRDPVHRAVQLARLRPDCRAILILFDSDDDCPRELAPRIEEWATEEAGEIPCAVVMAHREYEAWFLAAVESLRGTRGVRDDAESHADPESPRGAKEQLEKRMRRGRSYSEKADQAALTARLDLAAAFSRCRSFRRMTSAVRGLLQTVGVELSEWPPAAWVAPRR